jgi:hypothetical protein
MGGSVPAMIEFRHPSKTKRPYLAPAKSFQDISLIHPFVSLKHHETVFTQTYPRQPLAFSNLPTVPPCPAFLSMPFIFNKLNKYLDLLPNIFGNYKAAFQIILSLAYRLPLPHYPSTKTISGITPTRGEKK